MTSTQSVDLLLPDDSAVPLTAQNTSMQSKDNAPSRALTVDEARNAILQSIQCTSRSESIEITQAIGRTLAEDIIAGIAIPSFENSAMDGYAIRHQDVLPGQKFQVIGKSLAGHPFSGSISAGEAVRVTTGAALPSGADAIVIQELVELKQDTFTTGAHITAGQYVRNPGDDISIGQTLCTAGMQLSAADIGLFAAQGISHVDVFMAPKVGVFSTGDELLTAIDKPAHGKIFDSNRATIRALLANAGIDSVDLGICKDEKTSLDAVMQRAANLDFVLSSGGVSVGEADFVKEVLQENGEVLFWKVAMKPGKPLISGRLSGGAHYFGLPGNPVSSMVTCLQFVIPAIQAFSGNDYKAPPTLRARCLNELTKEPGRFEFQRGIVEVEETGELSVSTTGLQDSHVLSSMCNANCFICLDQFADGAKAGEMVRVIFFSSIDGLK